MLHDLKDNYFDLKAGYWQLQHSLNYLKRQNLEEYFFLMDELIKLH